MNKILFNGYFYLGNKQWANALGIDKKGTITHIGQNLKEVEVTSSFDEKIDMNEKWIFPAFEDAHNHPAGHSRIFSELNFQVGNFSWEQAKNLIREKVATTSTDQWIVCHGWNESKWGRIEQMELNNLSNKHGIFLVNISYHGGLVNSKGIKMLIMKGLKLKDYDSGERGYLTETVFEKAFYLTSPGTEAYLVSIPSFLKNLLSLGIAAVHDMEVTTFEQLEAYAELERQGKLQMPIEIYVTPRLFKNPERLSKYIQSFVGLTKIRGLKLILDGAIGTSTAAVNQEYTNGAGQGILRMNFDECEGVIEKAAMLGLTQVSMHCIGDRSIDFAIDIFSKLRKKYAKYISIWRFEHFEMPSDRSIEILSRDKGIASMQPNFSWDTLNYKERLGKNVDKINPFRSIIDKGVLLVFGSDDMPSDPLNGIKWATYKAPFSHQRISIEEAVQAYTLSPAKVVGMDNIRGRIKEGYEGNFVVFEKNLLQVTSIEIENISVKETWVKGERIFG